jgi:hypothetical protein
VQYCIPEDEISLQGYDNLEEAVRDLITAEVMDKMSEYDISEDLISIESYAPSISK